MTETTGRVIRVDATAIQVLAQRLLDNAKRLQEESQVRGSLGSMVLPDGADGPYRDLLTNWRVKVNELAEGAESLSARAGAAGASFVAVERANAQQCSAGASK